MASKSKKTSTVGFFGRLNTTWGTISLIVGILMVGVGGGLAYSKLDDRLNTAEQTQLEQVKLQQQQADILKEQEAFKNRMIDLVLGMFQVDPAARTSWKKMPGKPTINMTVDSAGKVEKFIAINQPWVEIEGLNFIIKYEVVFDQKGNLQLLVDTVFNGRNPTDTTKHSGFGSLSTIKDGYDVVGAYRTVGDSNGASPIK